MQGILESFSIVPPPEHENPLYSNNLPLFLLALQSRPYHLDLKCIPPHEVEYVRMGVKFENKKNQEETIPARASKRKNYETNVESNTPELPQIYPIKTPSGLRVTFEFAGCTVGNIGRLQLYCKAADKEDEELYEFSPVIVASKEGKSYHASFLKLFLHKTGADPLTETLVISFLENIFTKFTSAERPLLSNSHMLDVLLGDLNASNGIITKENFENFLKWNGKFMTFMSTVKTFLTYWNNGAILGWLPSSYCSKLLENKVPGTFILQISHRNPQYLAIDVRLSVTQLPQNSSSPICAIILEKISSESSLKDFVSNYSWLENVYPDIDKVALFGPPTNLSNSTFADYYNQSKAIQIPQATVVTTTTTTTWNIWIKFEEEDFVAYSVAPTITISDLKKCVPNVLDIGKYKIFKEDNTPLDSRTKLVDCLADENSVIMKKMS